MNRKFFTSCHKIITCTSYSRPLFTSARLFGLSRLDKLRVTTGFQGVLDLDVKNNENLKGTQIIKYTSSKHDSKLLRNRFLSEDNKINHQINKYSSSKDSKPLQDKVQSEDDSNIEDIKKLSLFQRFKAMYRDYWYVLIPVHVVTSIGWFVGFYYLATSGLDLVSLAEKINLSESLTNKLRHGGSSSITGYLAITYALYKIATPIRYTVTIGGTTLSINYLKKLGHIKPIPKKDELKKMYECRKESLKGKRDEMKAFVSERLNPKKRP